MTAAASRPKRCRASSTPPSRPRRAAPDWAWRSPAGWWRAGAGPSPSRAPRVGGPPSPSRFRARRPPIRDRAHARAWRNPRSLLTLSAATYLGSTVRTSVVGFAVVVLALGYAAPAAARSEERRVGKE